MPVIPCHDLRLHGSFALITKIPLRSGLWFQGNAVNIPLVLTLTSPFVSFSFLVRSQSTCLLLCRTDPHECIFLLSMSSEILGDEKELWINNLCAKFRMKKSTFFVSKVVVDRADLSEWSPRHSPSMYMKSEDFGSPLQDPSRDWSKDSTLRKFIRKWRAGDVSSATPCLGMWSNGGHFWSGITHLLLNNDSPMKDYHILFVSVLASVDKTSRLGALHNISPRHNPRYISTIFIPVIVILCWLGWTARNSSHKYGLFWGSPPYLTKSLCDWP
jgi:hypothetical protein